jgi:alpha/beta superfamily hydrolase
MRSHPFEFDGERGTTLFGRLDLPDGPPHAFALLAHCFTCTKNSLAAVRISRALTSQGIGVLRFDFTGQSTFIGSVQDLMRVITQEVPQIGTLTGIETAGQHAEDLSSGLAA